MKMKKTKKEKKIMQQLHIELKPVRIMAAFNTGTITHRDKKNDKKLMREEFKKICKGGYYYE